MRSEDFWGVRIYLFRNSSFSHDMTEKKKGWDNEQGSGYLPIYAKGWYARENDGITGFRWMGRSGSVLFKEIDPRRPKIFKIRAGHPFPNETNPTLAVEVNGDPCGKIEVLPGERSYYFPIDHAGGEARFDLRLDRFFEPQVSGDQRELGIQVRTIELLILENSRLLTGEGWHDIEFDGRYRFRWTDRRSVIYFDSNLLKRYAFLSFHADSPYPGMTQSLTIGPDGREPSEIRLQQGWCLYSIPFGNTNEILRGGVGRGSSCSRLRLTLNRTFTERHHPKFPRELGVKIRDFRLHNDRSQHKRIDYFLHNAALNYREMTQGRKRLSSYPLYLGIDMFGECNIKPPCVYCEWDGMKKAEGPNVRARFDERTLKDYGPFFRSARRLVNCSIGEPLLNPHLKEIVSTCRRNHKILEMASNGQSLSPAVTESLVGKNIDLYISLDAACGETYARIRNDRWDHVIANLMHFSRERKRHRHLPLLLMVFMPMRVNRGDLEGYFLLCRKLEADALILRPLNFIEDADIEITRAGYRFNYKEEMLNPGELEDIFRKCREYSKKYRVQVGSQFEFGLDREREPGVNPGRQEGP